MAVLKRQDLSLSEWLAKVQNLTPPGEAWMIVETHLDCQFTRFVPAQVSEHSYRGRVFCDSGEWKWRLLPGVGYRCVFLGESDWSQLASDGAMDLSQLHLESATRDIALWGEYDQERKVWLEQKIARHFAYPLDAPQKKRSRALLTIEEWQDDASGQVQFARYRSLRNQV